MDTDFAKWLATLGVGGILAAIFYYQARKDSAFYAETLLSLHEVEKGRSDRVLDVVISNTNQTIVNTEVLRSLHKRLDKDEVERVKRDGDR